MDKTNPRSYKQIVAINFGEKVCAEHAPTSAVPTVMGLGICYACASLYNEPKREKLARKVAS